MTLSPYGKKGGTSANAGRKAATYLVNLPDGSQIKRRTYFPPEDPRAYCYEHGGKWNVTCIDERDVAHLKHYRQIACKRIK